MIEATDQPMILLLPSSDSVRRHAPNAMLFGASLTAKLGFPIQIRTAATYDALVSSVLRAEVHLAWAPPVVCARVEDDVRCIIKSIRQGRSSYQAALVVRAGEVRDKLALYGLRAAWVDPLSSGGYLLAAHYLASIAMPPDAVFEEQVFTGSYRAALEAVSSGSADVTSIYVTRTSREHARERLIDLAGKHADRLDVLMFTRATPNDGVIITKAADERQAAAISEILIREPPISLIKALEVEGFERALPADYRMLR
jgi:ABC-type phosphate/phosphonate transport system substrate-binding protein